MITSDGFLIIGGRDARQNEIIFSKRLEERDIILHADIVGAPLTVIKSEGKEITPLAIREAAEFAAAFSSAWKKGLGGLMFIGSSLSKFPRLHQQVNSFLKGLS